MIENFYLAFEQRCDCGKAVVGSRQVKTCATLVVAGCQRAETNTVSGMIPMFGNMGDTNTPSSPGEQHAKALQVVPPSRDLKENFKYISPPDPLIMLLGSRAHVVNKVRCLAWAKGRQKYDGGRVGRGLF